MKKLLLILMCFMALGCAYEGRNLSEYFEDPRSLIRDPHFTEYKEERDELESLYLSKEIDYAEYVERMDELDKTYAKEVAERDAKIAR
jgi:hypothetical protein